jgi:hypothetical protein
MKVPFATLATLGMVLACTLGCDMQNEDVVDLNKVVDALVAVLDEGAKPNTEGAASVEGAANAATAVAAASPTDATAEITSTSEIQEIEPEKQDPAKESEFLKKYAAKLNELKAMNSPIGVSMSPGGEIIGFKDSNQNMVQELGEPKEFTVTIDPENSRLVASDNHGYHRPHGYGFSPGSMMMGYMLGSMMGRQGRHYSGGNASAKPTFKNTTMSPSNYHKSAVNSVRSSKTSRAASSSARVRTGSKSFSFGK